MAWWLRTMRKLGNCVKKGITYEYMNSTYKCVVTCSVKQSKHIKNGKLQWQLHYQHQMAINQGCLNLHFQYISINPQLLIYNMLNKKFTPPPIYSNHIGISQGLCADTSALHEPAQQSSITHSWYGICDNMAWNMELIKRVIRRPC